MKKDDERIYEYQLIDLKFKIYMKYSIKRLSSFLRLLFITLISVEFFFYKFC